MIRRAPGRDRYVVIDQTAVRDERLSFKARGLLAYLLSLPDDWRINCDDLATRGPDGRHAVLTAMRELRDAGYVTTTRYRNDDSTLRTVTTLNVEVDR